MAMGTAVLGIGGAAYAYMQTEEGRIWGDQAFTWVENKLGLESTPVPSNKNKKSLQDSSTKAEIKAIKPTPFSSTDSQTQISGLPNQ